MAIRDHVAAGESCEPDEMGWYHPECACGYEFGAVPDVETLADVLMGHAYEAGRSEEGEL